MHLLDAHVRRQVLPAWRSSAGVVVGTVRECRDVLHNGRFLLVVLACLSRSTAVLWPRAALFNEVFRNVYRSVSADPCEQSEH